jgi:hypothetical protein
MVPLRIPSPDCGQGIFLLAALLIHSSQTRQPHRASRTSSRIHMHACTGEPSSRSSRLSLRLPLSLMPPTCAVSTIPSEHCGRGAGMQRT